MLDRETVKSELIEFSEAYGWPNHIKNQAQQGRLVDIYTKQLSRHFHDGNFSKGLAIAWDQAVRFPAVSDFFRGYEAPEEEFKLPEGYVC